MDKDRMLVGLAAGLDRCIAVLGREEDLGTAVLCLRMAQMELRRMIHGLSDREYDALCETTGWLSCNPRGDLAS
jgi:hypothetical protein